MKNLQMFVKCGIAAFATLLACAGFAASPAIDLLWNAVIGADGVLCLDSTKASREFEWARYAMSAENEPLRPNTRYEVTFRTRVEGTGPSSYLYVIVRPASVSGAERDVDSLPVLQTDGGWRCCRMKFTTGAATDFRLQFHSHGRIRAEIADLRIAELRSVRMETVKPTAQPVARPSALPAGAREFEVDLPRPGGGLVLDAADFGVSVDNADNTASLGKALAAAKERGAAMLKVAPGDYRLTDTRSLTLEGFSDFTFDAQGARFISSRKRGAFLKLRRCVRTRLMNFSVDWDWDKAPLASVVEVRAVGEGYVDLRFTDYERFPNRSASFLVLSPFDPVPRSVGVEGMSTKGVGRLGGDLTPFPGEWLGPNLARLRTNPSGLKVGEFYRLQHYYYHLNGIVMDSNEHLRLENVRILSTPGHAFVMGGTQHHTLFDHVDIVAPKDDPRRVITCTADHFHIARSRGFLKLDHCEFSLGGDDILNMHDCSGFARPHGPKTVRTQNAGAYGNLAKGTRVELRQCDYSPTGFIGTVVEDRAVDASQGVFDITFEEDLPPATDEGFVMFDRTYDTHNVIVRNSYFHDNRARGLLILARDVTVENNVFRHQEMGAIKIETGYTFNAWSEGYGVSNVVIRGNLFENQNPSGSNSLHRERTVYVGIYLRKDPSGDVTDYPIIRDLLFERNTFRNSCGVAAYVTSAKGVTFLDNVFEDPTPRQHELPYRSQLYFANARDVKVYGSDYRPSPSVTPAVVYDAGSCERIDVR